MKTKKIITAALAISLIAATGSALAGQRWNYQVFINDASRYAGGAMADVRATADANQVIGCWSNATTGSSTTCTAISSAGVSRTCFSTNAAIVDTVRSITTESYIYFQWNADGTCAYVLVDNSSRFKPAATSGN